MPLLEAFLASALTMLSLAMIATLVVEFVHRLARTRTKNLRVMLEQFYDSELKTFAQSAAVKGGDKLVDKTEFIGKLMTNPLVKNSPEAGTILSSLNERTNLSTVDLFKVLADTDIGKEIRAKTEAEIDEFVDSLSRAYEAFEVAATDLFRRRAQVGSLIAGVVVAFSLNVNAVLILESYLEEPQARAKTIAQTDAALEAFKKRAEIVGTFRDTQKIQDDLDAIREGIQGLENVDMTFGYRSYKMPIQPPKNSSFPWWIDFVFWALGVCGTGLLIGLGGPFWFNVVRKLSETLQVVRGGNAPTGAALPGTPTAASGDPMKANQDAFKMAGGLPPLLKAQANLAAASRAATDADRAVKAAADALIGTREATKDDPDLTAAVISAKEALAMATTMQNRTYALKAEAMAGINMTKI